MKSILIVIAISLSAPLALAEMPSYSCSKGDIENIVTYSPISFEVRDLSEDEVVALEKMIDAKYDCNEGVEILDTVKDGAGVSLIAVCSVDSLGSKTVLFPLDCEETYLN